MLLVVFVSLFCLYYIHLLVGRYNTSNILEKICVYVNTMYLPGEKENKNEFSVIFMCIVFDV